MQFGNLSKTLILSFGICCCFILNSCRGSGFLKKDDVGAQSLQRQYYPQQYQQQPYYYSPYSQVAPGSRSYSNPYAIPPSQYYQNYDVDTYYTPPSYYRGVEPQYNAEEVYKKDRERSSNVTNDKQ